MKVWMVSICLLGLISIPGYEVCQAGSIFSADKLGEILKPVDVRSKAMGGTSVAFVGFKNGSKTNPAVWCTFDQAGVDVVFTSEQRIVKDKDGYEHAVSSGTPGALKLFVPLGYDIVFPPELIKLNEN